MYMALGFCSSHVFTQIIVKDYSLILDNLLPVNTEIFDV